MSFVPFFVYEQTSKEELLIKRKQQFDEWQHFFFKAKENELTKMNQTRDPILQSWVRCRGYEDLNPMIEGSLKNVSDEEIKDLRRQSELFQMAQPILKNAEKDLLLSKHVMMFCDENGIMLDFYGDTSVLRKISEQVNANPGANWSERWAGTNAIGTSIYMKEPIQIFSSEHFAYGCHDWVCSAAPVMNPLTNEVIGVVNISSPADYFHPLSMTKTINIANQIERLYFQKIFRFQDFINSIYFETIKKANQHIVTLWNKNGELWKHNQYHLKDDFKNLITTRINYFIETSSNEMEENISIEQKNYHAKFKKIYYQHFFIGIIAILEEKKSMIQSTRVNNLHAKYSFQNLVGRSPSFEKTIKSARIAATSDANVLITGESGTGKELIANSIHQASIRSEHPFIAINCSAIPKDLLASELFGYVGGAFTGANPKGKKGKFELANKGTIFLDEIADMPLESQVQLLRVIQEQEVTPIGSNTPIPIDVRIIAATNKDFEIEIEKGNFREDLFYRLNVIPIEIPSLKERIDDVPLLVEHFLDKFAKKYGKGPFNVTNEAMDILTNYHWPGNIRQLQNTIEYAVTFAENYTIDVDHLPKNIFSNQQKKNNTDSTNNPIKDAELHWIISGLKETNFNISQATKVLNMSRSTIYRKLKEHGVTMRELKQKSSI